METYTRKPTLKNAKSQKNTKQMWPTSHNSDVFDMVLYVFVSVSNIAKHQLTETVMIEMKIEIIRIL